MIHGDENPVPGQDGSEVVNRRPSRFGDRLLRNVRDTVDNVNQELETNETISQAREAVRQGVDNAAGAANERAPGLVQGVQRTGDVLTGADIRKFDEFTEAVTRVCVGLHRDNIELRDQVASLEQQLEEVAQLQAQLADRVAVLERQACLRAGGPNEAQG